MQLSKNRSQVRLKAPSYNVEAIDISLTERDKKGIWLVNTKRIIWIKEARLLRKAAELSLKSFGIYSSHNINPFLNG